MPRSTTPRTAAKATPRPTAPAAPRKRSLKSTAGSNGDRPPISVEEIARRAYELYEARGRTDGAQVDDWLAAEQQLAELYAGAADHIGPLTASKRKRAPKSGAASQ